MEQLTILTLHEYNFLSLFINYFPVYLDNVTFHIITNTNIIELKIRMIFMFDLFIHV